VQNKLQSLTGQHSELLENLSPTVRKRVEDLREIQACPFFLPIMILCALIDFDLIYSLPGCVLVAYGLLIFFMICA
jgi:hypothetical protein